MPPGIYKSLIKDNGVREGEVFQKLKDFLLVLETISTSLKQVNHPPTSTLTHFQMAPGEREEKENDLLVQAFVQLAVSFKLR